MKKRHQRTGVIWVIAQFMLIGGWCYILISLQVDLIEHWSVSSFRFIAGALSVFAGITLFVVATLNLGSNLTPLPEPKPTAHLVQSGLYSRVRHPIYGGILLILWGITLLSFSFLLIGSSFIITLFFTAKSAYEERRLIDQYPDYIDYRKKTWKFIPKPF